MAGQTFTNWAETYQPRWAVDYKERAVILPGGAKLVAAQFPVETAVTVTTTAAAAIGATTVAVTALTGPIPSGTILDFTGAGKFALLTAAAATGATTLTVEALTTALASGDVATYTGASGRRYVPAGTLIGRTFAERDAGTGYGPWATGDNEVYLVLHDIFDAALNNDVDLYHGRVKENFLPGFATLPAASVAAIRANFRTTKGVA
ncbi:MAG: hypothetical protein M3439_03535 [Chloroflexota bacterium]|nr:hypothetical protein [Chloroflexota bacterium]